MDKFKDFFMYDQHTDPKYDAAKNSLFNMRRVLQHLQRNFELYWYPARYFSINEQTIRFQGIHKDKIWITLKYAGGGSEVDAVYYCDYTYSFIYHNDDIPDSKNYLCTTSEISVWLFKTS